jgi:hypothetical protein
VIKRTQEVLLLALLLVLLNCKEYFSYVLHEDVALVAVEGPLKQKVLAGLAALFGEEERLCARFDLEDLHQAHRHALIPLFLTHFEENLLVINALVRGPDLELENVSQVFRGVHHSVVLVHIQAAHASVGAH